jgi:hypothetical protein
MLVLQMGQNCGEVLYRPAENGFLVMRNQKSVKEIESGVSEVLCDLGFKKRGRSWYRVTDETVQVTNLQRSQWGEQYYLNFGILIRALDETRSPRPSQCHFVARLAMLVSGRDPNDFVIDLEKAEPQKKLKGTLQTLASVGKTFLEKCATLKGMREFLRTDPGVLVSAEAREFLMTKSASK